MTNFTPIITSVLTAEYLVLAGIILVLVDFSVCIFALFLRSDAIYNNSGSKRVANFVLLGIEIAYIIFSMVIFTHERFLLQLSLPLNILALVITILIVWGSIQMHGLADRSMEVLETLVGVLEAGDENLDGHSLHVQNLSMLIYDYLPIKDRLSINRVNLQYASLFLDIGKLGIPRSIIDKKGKLTFEERELIKHHPEICESLFEHIPSFKIVTYWVKYHHERVDGNGYHRLNGAEIPLASRILALADTYSAITMPRSYKASLPYENAISELRLVAGTQLDADLVEVFCAIPKHKVLACMEDVKNRMKIYQAGDFR